MKPFLIGVAGLALLVLPHAALAVTQTTEVALTEKGQPIPNAQVTLTIKEPPPPAPPRTARAPRPKPPPSKPVETTTVKTDPGGRFTLTYDDEKFLPDMLVDIAVTLDDGRTITRSDVPFSQVVAGAPLDVAPPPPVRARPRPRAPQVALPGTPAAPPADRFTLAGPRGTLFQPEGPTAGITGGGGRAHLPDGLFLRAEIGGGGAVIPGNVLALKRQDPFYSVGAYVNGIPVGGGFSLNLNYNAGWSNTDTRLGSVNLPGDGVGIPGLGVEAGGGALGQGFFAGPANITGTDLRDTRFTADYKEHLFLATMSAPSIWSFDGPAMGSGARPVTLTPSAGLMFGYVKDTSTLSGVTAGNPSDLTFRYDTEVETFRVGLQLGLDLKVPLGTNWGLYSNGAVRLIHDSATARASLEVGGPFAALFPDGTVLEGTASVTRNRFNIGGLGGAGVYFEPAPYLTGRIGGHVETWSIGRARVLGDEPLDIDWGDRLTYGIQAQLSYAFPPPPSPSP